MKLKKIILGTAVGAGVVAGITYLARLRQTGADIQSIAKVSVFKLDLNGLTLRVDVTLKNPTRTKFAIKFPFVSLSYKGNLLGSSQSVNQDITIPAYGQAVAEKIMIQIPGLKLLTLTGGFFKSLQSGEPLQIDSVTSTTINLGIKQIPYKKTETITLKK
jgi:hypothetical protein